MYANNGSLAWSVSTINENRTQSEPRWQVPAPQSKVQALPTNGGPLVYNNTIYICNDGVLRAVSLQGQTLWTANTACQYYNTPMASLNIVCATDCFHTTTGAPYTSLASVLPLIMASDGSFLSYNVTGNRLQKKSPTGQTLWSITSDADGMAAFNANETVVYIMLVQCEAVVALNYSTGELLWDDSTEDDVVPSMCFLPTTIAVMPNGNVIIGSPKGPLNIFSPTGRLISYNFPFPNSVYIGTVVTAPDGGGIFASPLLNNHQYAMSRMDDRGQVIWSLLAPVSTIEQRGGAPALDQRAAYFSTNNQTFALERNTGTVLWKIGLLEIEAYVAPPVVTCNCVGASYESRCAVACVL